MALIWELVISKAQRLINKACAFDLNWDEYANELNGKLICVNITQADCTVFAKITDEQIVLSSSSQEPADLTVTGKPLALMQLAEKNNTSSEVKIEGCAHLAQTLQKMLKQLDIDWEGFVALYTGDTISYGLTKIKTQMEEIWKHGKNTLLENAGEYLLYEKNMSPTKEEVASFLREVTDLNYDTDRIEARIKLLTEKLTDNVH